MKKINFLKFILALGIISMTQNGFSQVLKINSQKSSMTISGTTNVHNFKSKVTQISGEMTFADKQPKTMRIEIPVKSIVSDEKLMDKKTYEAFNEPKNPKIVFTMTDVTSMQINGNQATVKVVGNLTMAGVTKKVTLTSTGKKTKAGTYEFSGSTQIAFTDYGMKPPTAMLGVMKVGNIITLSYNVTFEGSDVI
jgi:polyisoprenoid-binding protein YceI